MPKPTRRRSPLWVREMDRRQLHGLTWRLLDGWRRGELSDAQEWLLGACESELAYRWRRARWPEPRCTCELCFSELEHQAADVEVAPSAAADPELEL